MNTLPVLLWLCSPATAQTLDQARSWHRSGELGQALEAYRGIAAATINPAADRAAAANNACVILLDTGRYRDALEYCEQARALRIETGDTVRLARSLNNYGAVLEALGRYRQAEAIYREALHINRVAGDNESAAINQANLGVLATQTADYARALSHYGEVVRLATAALPRQWAQEQLTLTSINRGVVYERLGAYREALAAYRAIIDDAARLPPQQRAALHVNVGVAFRNLGDPVRALAEFGRAATLFEQVGDRASLAAVWLDRGIVAHYNYRDYDRAADAYEQAMSMAADTEAFDLRLEALYQLGRVALERQQNSNAQQRFDQILAEARARAMRAAQWAALEGLGRVALRRENYRAASAYLEQAMELVAGTRERLDSGNLRQAFFDSQRSVYALAVEAAWRAHAAGSDGAARAYAIVQQAKVRELLASLPGRLQPLDVADLQQRLDNPLLEFFAGEDSLYAWFIDTDSVQMERYAGLAGLQSAIDAALAELTNGQPGAAVQDISDTLLAPFAQGLRRSKRLVVAPDGDLYRLPLDSLAGPTGRALVQTHVLTYIPSGSIAVAAVADTDYPATLVAVGAPLNADQTPYYATGSALPDLPGAQSEISNLGALVRGKQQLLTGARANEHNVLQWLGKGAAIAHFATHTVLDDRLGPAIVLSPTDEDDGLLFPSDISRAAPLPAGLTVLAACRSGLGGIENGRALNSLTGALIAAGSGAVLATLWDVEDAYAGVFMTEFYRVLARGHRPARALSVVKRRFRDAAGGDWAAFVLFGDPPAPLPWRPRYFFLGTAVFLGLIAFFIGRRSGKGMTSSS